jgi:hypothetical protein
MTDKKLLIERIKKETSLSSATIQQRICTGYWSNVHKEKVLKIINAFEKEKNNYLENLRKI